MLVNDLLKKSLDECCHIIFPKVCLHCKEKISGNFFCDTCLASFELVEVNDLKIFPAIPYPVVAAFEDIGAINTFFLELKKMVIPVFAKIAASYMVLQYLKCQHQLPDIVVPLSDSGFGIKYTDIVAKEVAILLERPIKKMFFHPRIAMLQNALFVKNSSLQNKSLLIVIDKLDEKKLKGAIDLLEQRNFKNIRILALCQ